MPQRELADLGYDCGFPDKTYQPIHTRLPSEGESKERKEKLDEEWIKKFDTFPEKKPPSKMDEWIPSSRTGTPNSASRAAVLFVLVCLLCPFREAAAALSHPNPNPNPNPAPTLALTLALPPATEQ